MPNPRIAPLRLSGDIEQLGDTLSTLRKYVAEAAVQAGLETQFVNRLKLAVDEVAANIVMYGYGDVPEPGVIDVTTVIDDERLTITLEDSGTPYDPTQREVPTDLESPLETREMGGLGVYLAIHNVDEFNYRTVNKRNINQFIMKRPRIEGQRSSVMEAVHPTRFLVVDDHVENRDALVAYLEQQGGSVLVAGDGETALELLHAEDIDMVLLSLNIPKLDGHQVLERVKTDSHLSHIPVIVVSAQSSPDSIVRAVRLGADDYVREPLSFPALAARIEVSLEKARLREEQTEHLQEIERVADLMERVILPMGVALSTETDFDHLAERILLEAKNICNADAGTLYLRTDDDHLRFAIVRTQSLGIALGGTSGNPIAFPTIPLYNDDGEPNQHNVASHVALSGHSINIPDVYTVEGFDFSAAKAFDKQNNYRSVSSLTVPLKDNKGSVIGVMQLLNALDEYGNIVPFNEYNRLIVELLASQAAVVLNNHLLIQRQQMLNKIENDIQIARTIQTNFLPNTMPPVPGWEVYACFHPAREVAGDFYDVFMMDDGKKLAFLIADVCDKGVGAALFMALARSLLRAFSMQTVKRMETGRLTPIMLNQMLQTSGSGAGLLRTAVGNTNDYITRHHLELNMFATLFFAVLDPETGKMVYINGGHCPPMIISSTCQVKERLEPTGAAVGMFAESEFEVGHAQLEHGDILLLFTDGITDARDPDGAFFGEAGVVNLLMPPAASAKDLVDRIDMALHNHIGDAVQFDDITMLSVSRE